MAAELRLAKVIQLEQIEAHKQLVKADDDFEFVKKHMTTTTNKTNLLPPRVDIIGVDNITFYQKQLPPPPPPQTTTNKTMEQLMLSLA